VVDQYSGYIWLGKVSTGRLDRLEVIKHLDRHRATVQKHCGFDNSIGAIRNFAAHSSGSFPKPRFALRFS